MHYTKDIHIEEARKCIAKAVHEPRHLMDKYLDDMKKFAKLALSELDMDEPDIKNARSLILIALGEVEMFIPILKRSSAWRNIVEAYNHLQMAINIPD